MGKRIIAGLLGTVALLGNVLPLGYALEIFKDFGSPDIPFWPNAFGEVVMCAIAIVALRSGVQFLKFALSHPRSPDKPAYYRRVRTSLG